MKIVTGGQMADIDKATIEKIGIPGIVLMENAARAFTRKFHEFVSENDNGEECSCGCSKPRVLALCGSGNNGGDGFAIARILYNWGYPVRIVHVGRPQTLKEDAGKNFEIAQNLGIEIISIKEDQHLELLEDELDRADWIIDALFGTGLDKPVRGVAKKALEIASSSGLNCAAVDIPSGVNADNGQVLGEVIPADLTVTFGLPKWGHAIYPGSGYVGELYVADIGFPASEADNPALKCTVTDQCFVQQFIDYKKEDAYKTSYGKLAVVGGSRSLLGAVLTAGKAALRTGCGYVEVYLPHYLEPAAKTAAPELVTAGLPDMEGGYINSDGAEVFFTISDRISAMAIGPGLGARKFTQGFLLDILDEFQMPLVIDADGLNLLAEAENYERKTDTPWILTPHPGEAARLLGAGVEDILADPLMSAWKIAKKFNAVVTLKLPNTITVSPEGRTMLNTTGCETLAVMGTGDILTGIIGALIARGIPAFEAAAVGVYIHGLMGETASDRIAPEGVLPDEMAGLLPEVMELIRNGTVKSKIGYIK